MVSYNLKVFLISIERKDFTDETVIGIYNKLNEVQPIKRSLECAEYISILEKIFKNRINLLPNFVPQENVRNMLTVYYKNVSYFSSCLDFKSSLNYNLQAHRRKFYFEFYKKTAIRHTKAYIKEKIRTIKVPNIYDEDKKYTMISKEHLELACEMLNDAKGWSEEFFKQMSEILHDINYPVWAIILSYGQYRNFSSYTYFGDHTIYTLNINKRFQIYYYMDKEGNYLRYRKSPFVEQN